MMKLDEYTSFMSSPWIDKIIWREDECALLEGDGIIIVIVNGRLMNGYDPKRRSILSAMSFVKEFGTKNIYVYHALINYVVFGVASLSYYVEERVAI